MRDTIAASGPLKYEESPVLQVPDALHVSNMAVPVQSTPEFTVTLPIIMGAYRNRPPCTPDSPFSIQIAAIHQVDPGQEEAAPERVLEEAEWQARIQEGFPTLVEALAASGACWTRAELSWPQIQPDAPPAPYDYSFFDGRLQLLAESGVQIGAMINKVPSWAGDPWHGPIYPERLGDFTQFLTDVVNRYKQPPYNIHHWELFNEPDVTDIPPGTGGYGFHGDQYAEMLQVAYPAIKAADPSATVLMGGIAYDWFIEYGGPFNRYFADDVMAGGGRDFVDATNFHYFPAYWAEWERWTIGNPPTCGDVEDGLGIPYQASGVDVIAKATHFRNRLQVCFGVDRPTWLTELAEHGYEDNPGSLAQQARYVFQGYARALAAGMKNVCWFSLVTPPYDPYQQGLLFDADWSPKPSFYSYQTLTYELTGYQYSHALGTPNVEGYVFRASSGDEKVLAWSQGETLQTGSLTFAPADQLRVVGRDGQVTIVVDGGPGDADQIPGSVTVVLPPVPVDPDPGDFARITAEPLIIAW